ncbi:MAG: 4a-hydroxytetrahydrobiopterin dehydratase [Nitrososphaerota archaeon]
MRRLSERAVRTALKALPKWRLAGKRIVRVVRYEGFMPGVELLNEIAKVAEQMEHHPDVTVSYGKMRISVTTHDAGGLTELDFRLAERIEEILRSKGL